MAKGDTNQTALDAWGAAFEEIPKSVFAVVAYYLAGFLAEDQENRDAIFKRFAVEVEALRDNGFLDAAQARRVLRALDK